MRLVLLFNVKKGENVKFLVCACLTVGAAILFLLLAAALIFAGCIVVCFLCGIIKGIKQSIKGEKSLERAYEDDLR